MVVCVTNRKLCREDFFYRTEKIAAANVGAIILREKDLPEKEYRDMALKVKKICEKYDIPFIINTFYDTAKEIGVNAVHLPLPLFKKFNFFESFEKVGTSVHSADEAEQAEKADYIICGHIFETDCKKGVCPRGIEFLKSVKAVSKVPVFAIGGIDLTNAQSVIENGADGICIMSTFMTCSDEDIKKLCEL